jgi:Gpi18-like mannosyltransferase
MSERNLSTATTRGSRVFVKSRSQWCLSMPNRASLVRYVFILLLIACAVALRLSLFAFLTADTSTVAGWSDFIKRHGGFHALREGFSDYNVPYLYLIALITYIPIDTITAVKAISICFDFVLAAFVYLIVRLKYQGRCSPLFAAFAVLFAPTVVFNGALWGQCDSIYAAFSLGCIYFLLSERPAWALIFFGLAVSFKLQAIFLLPLLLVMLIVKRIPLQYAALPFGVYILLLTPAYLLGRSVDGLLKIYVKQVNEYHRLTLNAPSAWQWIPENQAEFFHTPALILAAAILLLCGFALTVSNRRFTQSHILKMALGFLLVVPFFLPAMHERYFYLADIASIAYSFYFPRLFYVAILVQIASFFSYLAGGDFKEAVIGLPYLALIVLFVIVIVITDLGQDLYDCNTNGKT